MSSTAIVRVVASIARVSLGIIPTDGVGVAVALGGVGVSVVRVGVAFVGVALVRVGVALVRVGVALGGTVPLGGVRVGVRVAVGGTVPEVRVGVGLSVPRGVLLGFTVGVGVGSQVVPQVPPLLHSTLSTHGKPSKSPPQQNLPVDTQTVSGHWLLFRQATPLKSPDWQSFCVPVHFTPPAQLAT